MSAFWDKKKEEWAEYKIWWPGQSWGWRWRNAINLIDDPVDMVKEWLHGHPLPFGYELNISFMMQNRATTWDIIRKRIPGGYPNSDPQDK